MLKYRLNALFSDKIHKKLVWYIKHSYICPIIIDRLDNFTPIELPVIYNRVLNTLYPRWIKYAYLIRCCTAASFFLNRFFVELFERLHFNKLFVGAVLSN